MRSDSGSSEEPLIPNENKNRGEIIEENHEKIHHSVQVMPRFPGGEKELYRFIRKNIIYPEMLREIRANGKVGILFIVDKTGELQNISVYQGTKYSELNTEALRVVTKMPKWEPGMQNGKPVRVQLILPIRFDVN